MDSENALMFGSCLYNRAKGTQLMGGRPPISCKCLYHKGLCKSIRSARLLKIVEKSPTYFGGVSNPPGGGSPHPILHRCVERGGILYLNWSYSELWRKSAGGAEATSFFKLDCLTLTTLLARLALSLHLFHFSNNSLLLYLLIQSIV